MDRSFKHLFKINPFTGEALKIIANYKIFKKKYKFLEESQWWTKNQLAEYQIEQLKNLINHAYTNVPYYTNLFNELGLKPRDIQDINDLKKLPYLTKKIIKENWKAFIAENYNSKKLEYVTTGGSTGEPLSLLAEKGFGESTYLAFYQSVLSRINCNFKNRQIHLIGNDKIWQYQAFGRVLTLSAFSMTNENLSLYVDKIKEFKPQFITGFPSAITILARYMAKNKIKFFPSVKAILSSGETIYDWQYELLKDTFQCKIASMYGHNELSVMAGTCEQSYYYHLFPEYGITEIINESGKTVSQNGKIGEIVATGFTNYAFPLIRYKTEDIGIFTDKKCKCGRNYPLIENIIGRVQQFIVTKSKRLIPLTGIYGLVARSTQNVKECQFLQEKEGEIYLRIVKYENFTNKDEKLIENSFQKKFQDEIKLNIHYVDKISRTTGGKHKFLIQNLPIEF